MYYTFSVVTMTSRTILIIEESILFDSFYKVNPTFRNWGEQRVIRRNKIPLLINVRAVSCS